MEDHKKNVPACIYTNSITATSHIFVTLHEKTVNIALDINGYQSEIRPKIVAYGDNYQISLFGMD